MQKKINLRTLSLFLVTIFLFSNFSSAIDYNTTKDIVTNKLELNGEITDKNFKNMIYVSPEGNDSGNGSVSSPYTLKKAIETANNDSCIIMLPGEYNKINGTIEINKNLTLIGDNSQKSRAVLNNFNDTVFLIKGQVEIENLDFKNNKATNGIIQNFGRLKMFNCTFQDNNATFGGTIQNLDNLTIEQCLFKNNNANIPSAKKIGHGGAIYNNAKLKVIESNFISNSALNEGGAIYNRNEMNISDSNFTDNNAGTNAGAIMNLGNCSLTNSYFKSNKVHISHSDTAYYSGGALYNMGELIVKTTSFKENNAVKGGAIYNKNSLTISDSSFRDNNAIAEGGAIITNGLTNTINNITFNGNKANSGGAIYGETDCIANVNKCSFTSNSAVQFGGAINNKGNFNVMGNSFKKNKVLEGGGAVYNSKNMNITNGNNFTENTAKFGGAIVNLNFMKIVDAIMISNSAGGGLNNENQYMGGGAVYNSNRLFIDGLLFLTNIASEGSALDNKGFSDIRNSNFTTNGYGKLFTEADNIYDPAIHGGAISNYNEMVIEYNIFKENRVSALTNYYNDLTKPIVHGGAIYNKGKGTVSHNKFYSNTATNTYFKRNAAYWTCKVVTFGLMSDKDIMFYAVGQVVEESLHESVFNEGVAVDMADNIIS
jgi:predicted outer membrane repeat protein